MKNYQASVCRYQPKPKAEFQTRNKAEIDNDKLRLDGNSPYYVKTEFNNCFIIYLKELIYNFIRPHLCRFYIPALLGR